MAEDRLQYYTQAMEIDQVTGKPMPKISGKLIESTIIQPVDIQTRYAESIQTHNGLSTGPGLYSGGNGYMYVAGFDKLCVNTLVSVSMSNAISIDWSLDGVNPNGFEAFSGTVGTRSSYETGVKLPYVKINVKNADAAPQTVSAWAYLKV